MKRTTVPAVLVALILSGCVSPIMLRDPESGHVAQCLATGAFPLINQQQCVASYENMGWVRTTAAEAREARTWEKPDATKAMFDADKAQCIVTASQQVPRELVTTSSGGGYTTPVQTNCYQVGNTVNCNSSGGVTQAPATTIDDANAETRNYAFDSCMYSKGYKRQVR